ncbi:hypothetical protein O3P69_009039 [Scylla paramamosain]|uniref:RING-type domain-containing protein n=1 Tax=Scylla paramamosain TaxID=85552 RepID=A0AAW0TRU3_SCYPA
MEASARAPPRPEEISSRLNQLTLELMAATNRLIDREIFQENTTNGIADVPQEREVTCPICFEQFGEEHAPRTLRCGHTVCTPCLETILSRTAGDRNCPECRRPLKVTAVAHIPVSYTIMRLARALEETCAAAAAAEAEVEEVSEAGVLGETCVRHHYPVLWWCSKCKAFQCRSCTHYEKCPERLPAGEAIVHLKQAQVESSERTVLALSKLKSDLETQRDKLNVSIDRMMEEVRQLETKVKKVQSQVLDVEEAEAHVVEASSACRMTRALARSEEVQAAAKVWLEHQNSRPSSPVDEEPITLNVLKQKLLVTKDIYALKHNTEGEEMFAPVTVCSDKLLVHNYSTDEPPSNALLISGDSLGISSEKKSVFFDIHVDGHFEGRMIIILFRPNGAKTTAFLDTCTNSHGYTYKGLKLHSSSVTVEETAARVMEVSHEVKDTADRYMASAEDDNYTRRNIYPGLVSGMCSNYRPRNGDPEYPTMSSFLVYLYHMNGARDPCGFGKVLSGLGVLRYAWDKREAVIGDCGMVLPLNNV